MNNQIKTYYIPTNPNIQKGPIYNLYKNKISNLNLSSILEPTITIKEQEYNKILEIINDYNTLLSEKNIQIKNLVNEENKSIKKLTTINKKKQEITSSINQRRE